MRIIGSVLLDGNNLGGTLMAAAFSGFLILSPELWRHRTNAHVRIGDLFWVKEPFLFWMDRKWGDDQLVFGTLITARKPESYSRLKPKDYSFHIDGGEGLRQRQSRLTLHVMERHSGGALKCLVIGENIAAHIARGQVAA